jgi:hypothetical protein
MRRNIITFIVILLLTSFLPSPHKAASSVPTQVPTPDPSIQLSQTEIINDLPEGYAFKTSVLSPDFIPVRGNIELTFSDKWNFYSNLAIDPDHPTELSYYLKAITRDIYPFVPFQIEWTVMDAQGRNASSGKQTIAGYDPRYDWQILKSEGRDLTIYTHDRDASFGDLIFDAAEHSANYMEGEFELNLTRPITVVIYNLDDEVLDYYTYFSENTGGIAVSDLGLTIQIIDDDDGMEDWINDVMPHEISHLYFHQALAGHDAPTWFNEGVAQVNEFSLSPDYLAVANASLQELQSLPDLRRLESNFNSGQWSSSDYDMAYSITSYIIYIYGKESIHAILSRYADGAGREKAFKDVLGVDYENLYNNWLETSIQSGEPAYYLDVTPMGILESANTPETTSTPGLTPVIPTPSIDKSEVVKGTLFGLAALGFSCFLLIVIIAVLIIVMKQRKKKSVV